MCRPTGFQSHSLLSRINKSGLSEGELESLRQASEMTALKATLLPIRTVGVQVGGATMGGAGPQWEGRSHRGRG